MMWRKIKNQIVDRLRKAADSLQALAQDFSSHPLSLVEISFVLPRN